MLNEDTHWAQIRELRRELNQVREELRSLRVQTSPTVRATKTAGGTFLEATPGRTAVAAVATPVIAGQLGMVFRGEWHGSLTVNAQDVFIVYTGTNAGMYVATEAMNSGGAEPGTGGFYVKIGEVFLPGLWI